VIDLYMLHGKLKESPEECPHTRWQMTLNIRIWINQSSSSTQKILS